MGLFGDDFNDDQALQGAAGGALTGASVGAAAGPWGAAIGGVVGGVGGALLGGFGGGAGSYEDRLKALSNKYGNRRAPQMGPAAQGSLSQFRQNQAALIAQLEAMGRGEGPSAATVQMREAMDRASAAQASGAAGAGGRGVNAGAAYRQAANNTAAITSQGARDTSTLRAQEQYQALQYLAQTVGQARQQDEAMTAFNAAQRNEGARANLVASMQTLGINTDAELKALLAALGVAGPGMGTQIMAGGATAAPMLLQRNPSGGTPAQPPPSDTGGLFGGYTRNADGSTGPITSPSQVG